VVAVRTANLLSSSAFMIGSEGISRAGAWQGAPEPEEVRMPIVGGLDIHRKQLTFDYPGTVTGEVKRGQIAPAGRQHLRAWLARFDGRDDVAFAMEGCTGWRYAAGDLTAAGVAAHVAEPADTAAARGRKRHPKTGKTGSRHLRTLLAEGRLPGCWVPRAPPDARRCTRSSHSSPPGSAPTSPHWVEHGSRTPSPHDTGLGGE
jgi:hypothetical protein